MSETLKGYKVFNPDWTCNGFKFEVGKEYQHDGEIKHCKSGFHFCLNLADCFNYYSFDPKNKIAEAEAFDKWITNGDKTVCNAIRLIREISWEECLRLCNSGYRNSGNRNSGDCNSGYRNSGDCNSGNCNSGYRNSGDCNSGDCNSGNYNSGNRNSGDCNSGNYNSGNYNSGDCNSGNYNSGDCNSGNYNSGFFNSDRPEHPRIFNRESNADWNCCYIVNDIINRNFYDKFSVWVTTEKMTEEEKTNYPSHTTTGGYLRVASYKEAWACMWENITDEEKQEFLKLPNFDEKIFEEITGIII